MKKKRKAKKIVIFLIITIIISLVGIISYLKKDNSDTKSVKQKEPVKIEKKLKIIDLDSNTRNIAIMYNNISDVWGYQAGLQDSYLVYEIIVEGGYTRLMAVFKDKNLARIGTIRSSRPYFLDYALENDAIYIHFGASNQALADIKKLGVNNINFMNYDKGYWRDRSLKLAIEHTAFTSTEKLDEGIEKYGYRTTTNNKPVLNYSVDEIDLSKKEGAIKADKVFIDYSAVRSTQYDYDSVNKVYLRSQGTAKSMYKHLDAVTKLQYTTKNIITYKVPNRTIDSYGRQAITNLGAGEGYYISNGYAVPIIWEKRTRSSKTIYRYLDGTEVKVNDGNTYIQIQPSNEELVIE